jgi:hypothetical protein
MSGYLLATLPEETFLAELGLFPSDIRAYLSFYYSLYYCDWDVLTADIPLLFISF